MPPAGPATVPQRPRGHRLFTRLLRSPALHFLLAGAALFAFEHWRSPSRTEAARERAPIVFNATDLERLRREWTQELGTPATAAQEESLLQLAVDEELLFREALAMGLDRNDRVVRNRLVQLGTFLALGPENHEALLEREARRLGLVESDPIVRRQLVQMVRLAAESPRPSDVPSEAELREYYARNAERWALAERVRLTHVYLSADRRGDSLATDAARLFDDLSRRNIGPEEATTLGDAFARGSRLALSTNEQIDRAFGPGFAAGIAAFEPGTWSGPVRSAYGLHLVLIQDREPARLPPLESVRNQVLLAYLGERGRERLQLTLRTLRERYPVEVERSAR